MTAKKLLVTDDTNCGKLKIKFYLLKYIPCKKVYKFLKRSGQLRKYEFSTLTSTFVWSKFYENYQKFREGKFQTSFEAEAVLYTDVHLPLWASEL